MNIFFSIVVPTFNQSSLLKKCLQSIANQTYKNWELIFWDNCSTDSSAMIFKGYKDTRLKYYVAKEHTNLGKARSLALEQARGDFIAVLDCDDLWVPTKLEKQLPHFQDHEVGIVISDILYFNVSGKYRKLYAGKLPPTGWVFEKLLTSYFISLGTVILSVVGRFTLNGTTTSLL